MFFKKKNCRSARFCLFLLHFLQTAVCKPETGIGLLVMLFRMPAGMCAIFTRDRLDHCRGCAPSSGKTEPILFRAFSDARYGFISLLFPTVEILLDFFLRRVAINAIFAACNV